MADRPKFVVVSMMRNEGPYILDWVAHYLALGFDHLVVFHNDCDDPTVKILKRLEKRGILTQVPNADMGGGLQRTALRKARRIPVVKEADWLFICDADEYLNIHVGDHRVEDLVATVDEDTDAISVAWRNFSTNGVEHIIDVPTPLQFTDCEPKPEDAPELGRSCKSLIRNIHKYKRLGTHQPVVLDSALDGYVRRFPGGHRIGSEEEYREGLSYDIAQVNHYVVRSIDGFMVKRDRGRVNHMTHVIGEGYFRKLARGGAFDDSIKRYEPMKAPILGEFMEDGVLARRHWLALEWHRERAEALRQDPEAAPVFEQVIRMSREMAPPDDGDPVEPRAASAG